jgi:hypothetical protein
LVKRYETQAQTLANLTGWNIADVRKKMGAPPKPPEDESWWDKVFGDDDKE